MSRAADGLDFLPASTPSAPVNSQRRSSSTCTQCYTPQRPLLLGTPGRAWCRSKPSGRVIIARTERLHGCSAALRTQDLDFVCIELPHFPFGPFFATAGGTVNVTHEIS